MRSLGTFLFHPLLLFYIPFPASPSFLDAPLSVGFAILLEIYLQCIFQVRLTEALRCDPDAETIFRWHTKIQNAFKLISSRSTTNIQDVFNFSSGFNLPVISRLRLRSTWIEYWIMCCASAMPLRRFKLAADLGISPNPS
jgi:hypothetical protein